MNDYTERLTAALADRYAIERELGAGGMATVYLADDLKHGRKVAIKVLRPELAAVVGGERFLAEIRTTAQLQHPNILPLFDSGEAQGFLFYVMPYVEGESLREKLDREKQLRVDDAMALVRKIGDALDYAHGKGVVHRDIKPANIMLSERGEPLVADFGIALAVSQAGGGRITETGLSLGTPHYMSPEQATGERDVDPRSDIYALGCVLYELLAGQPPFAAPTAQAVLARILTEQPRRVTELRRTVPPHVASVLDRALEKLPADRFESAQEFLDALDDPQFVYETQMAPALTRSTGGHPTASASSRRSLLVPALAGGLVLAIGAAAVGWLKTGPEAPSLPVTRVGVSDILRPGPGNSGVRVAISRDGSKIATIEFEEGERRLYWRRTSELGRTRIGAAVDPSGPTLSPDGRWLAFEDGDGMIRRVELAGGPALPVAEGGSPHWGTEDLIVFEQDGALSTVALSGGEPTRLVGNGPDEVQGDAARPHLLPDGSGVLFQAGDPDAAGDRGLYLYEMDSGEVVDLGLRGGNPKYVASGHLVFGSRAQALRAVPFDLRTLRPTGQATTVLVGVTVYSYGATQFDVSDNGTAIYEVGGTDASGDEALIVIGLDGREEPTAVEVGNYANPRWSADGRSVTYWGGPLNASSPHIYTYEPDLRRAARQWTSEGQNFEPVWSPDATRVVFASERAGTDEDDLFVKDVTNDEPPRLLLTMPSDQAPQDWPRDDLLVFLSYGDPSGIWSFEILDPTLESPRPTSYLESNFDIDWARVSPNGSLIAYTAQASSQADVPDIFVRSFPSVGQPVQVSSGGGIRSRWSSDGLTLWYWGWEPPDGLDKLIAATIDPGPPLRVVRTDTIAVLDVGTRQTDIHPDGDRLITVRSLGGTEQEEEELEAQALLVTNWFAELERLTGGGGR